MHTEECMRNSGMGRNRWRDACLRVHVKVEREGRLHQEVWDGGTGCILESASGFTEGYKVYRRAEALGCILTLLLTSG
jgi:hypothetical protein